MDWKKLSVVALSRRLFICMYNARNIRRLLKSKPIKILVQLLLVDGFRSCSFECFAFSRSRSELLNLICVWSTPTSGHSPRISSLRTKVMVYEQPERFGHFKFFRHYEHDNKEAHFITDIKFLLYLNF